MSLINKLRYIEHRRKRIVASVVNVTPSRKPFTVDVFIHYDKHFVKVLNSCDIVPSSKDPGTEGGGGSYTLYISSFSKNLFTIRPAVLSDDVLQFFLFFP